MKSRVHKHGFVAISIPVSSVWTAGFGIDLVNLLFACKPGKPLIWVNQVIGADHCSARSKLVEDAFKVGASHMLWLDADMRFPRDTLTRLLAHKKPIVGANYSNRKSPHNFTASKNGEGAGVYEIVKTMSNSKGIEPVLTMGFGVVLTSMEVFRKIPKPWFLFEYSPERTEAKGQIVYMGEDCYFCRKAKRAGFQIYVDHDLSKKVSHTATLDLPWHMPLSEEELDTVR